MGQDESLVVDRAYETWNSGDVSGLNDLYAADADVVIPGASVRGRDQVAALWGAFISAFPDGQLTELLRLDCGTYIVSENNLSGTHTAPLVTPARSCSAGRPARLAPGRSTAKACPSGEGLGTDHANSICSFSGLEDGDGAGFPGPGGAPPQNWGHVQQAERVAGATPADLKASGSQPGDSCNGHSGFPVP